MFAVVQSHSMTHWYSGLIVIAVVFGLGLAPGLIYWAIEGNDDAPNNEEEDR